MLLLFNFKCLKLLQVLVGAILVVEVHLKPGGGARACSQRERGIGFLLFCLGRRNRN